MITNMRHTISLLKIKVINHDVTQAFKSMHKKITNCQPFLITLQRGQSYSHILSVNVGA